jgi:Transglycosylase
MYPGRHPVYPHLGIEMPFSKASKRIARILRAYTVFREPIYVLDLPRILRLLVRACLALGLLAVLTVVGWLFFYTADLPVEARPAPGKFSHANLRIVICGEPVELVPAVDPTLLRMATIAAEGPPDRRPFIHLCHDMFFSDQPDRAYGNYSYQLARQMNCGQTGHALKHNLRELRTALQLERRFTPDQLLNLYLDRAYFGPGIYGAESAATHYFGKHAGELLVPEGSTSSRADHTPGLFFARRPSRSCATTAQPSDRSHGSARQHQSGRGRSRKTQTTGCATPVIRVQPAR